MCRKQDKESITVGTGEKEECVCVSRIGVYSLKYLSYRGDFIKVTLCSTGFRRAFCPL